MNNNDIDDIYYIFIDESGSINRKSFGSFLVSLFIVKKSNLNKVKKYSIKHIHKFKTDFKFGNCDEVKAHDLKKSIKNMLYTISVIIYWNSILHMHHD